MSPNKVSVKVERTFRINGKEYASLHEMPADVRLLYERAVASDPSLAVPPTTAPASGGLPYLPPPIDAEDDTRSRRLVIAIVAALVAAVLVWLLAHH